VPLDLGGVEMTLATDVRDDAEDARVVSVSGAVAEAAGCRALYDTCPLQPLLLGRPELLALSFALCIVCAAVGILENPPSPVRCFEGPRKAPTLSRTMTTTHLTSAVDY